MVSADEFGRSLRGASAIVGRRPDALAIFDLTDRGFHRSFAAISLTLPAYVVSLAMERHALGLDIAHAVLFDDLRLALLVALGHVVAFLALPLATAIVVRGTPFAAGFAPFVTVTNWISVFGSLALALPTALYLTGFAPGPMAALVTVAFTIILLQSQWFATRVTLGVGGAAAAAVTGLGLLLDLAVGGIVRGLAF